jgi:hypothetical protein
MTWHQPDFFSSYGGDKTAFVIERPSKPSQQETHRRPTQAGRILAHLRAGNRLTALDALESFGCFRLAARIHELRREGWQIEERTVETRGGKRVAEYSIGGAA